jgi:hypothetical protein
MSKNITPYKIQISAKEQVKMFDTYLEIMTIYVSFLLE